MSLWTNICVGKYLSVKIFLGIIWNNFCSVTNARPLWKLFVEENICIGKYFLWNIRKNFCSVCGKIRFLGNIQKNFCSVTSARPLWKISGVRPLTGTLLDGATRKDWTTAVYMNCQLYALLFAKCFNSTLVVVQDLSSMKLKVIRIDWNVFGVIFWSRIHLTFMLDVPWNGL